MSLSPRDPVQHHIGHLFMECMKQRPDAICQIDAFTGNEETNASVLSRSVRLARCFRNMGLQPGDVLSIGGNNHLDLHIPFYAALLNGLPVSGVDPLFKYDEIKSLFELSRPKIAFCQKETHDIYKKVINALGLDTKLVTFGGGESSMEEFIETYDTNESPQDYMPAEFDQNKIYAFLISTSGTSGKLKLAAIKHANMISKINMFAEFAAAVSDSTTGPHPINLYLSPVNWISGFCNAVRLLVTQHIKLQTSNPDNIEHIMDIINKYKPVSSLMSGTIISSLTSRKEDVDLTCFRFLTIGGAKIFPDVKIQFQALLHEDALLMEAYGLTETLGPCLISDVREYPASCGRSIPGYQVKLVDPESGMAITIPHTPGEALVKGIMFSEYYNDPEETAKTHTEDGFYKTGDLLYFDEKKNFYYVDRLKSLIKFRNYHILPAELEEVIRTHPAVREVCVCGVPDPHDGQRPVACVSTYRGCSVAAQEIKDLVASKLSKNKELSGGVVFLDELPMTSSGKIARMKLLDIVSKLQKE